jgi:hypothetical protein
MLQVLQIIGALLILSAFIALQVKRMEATSYVYLTLNAVGSALLAVLAVIGQQWGFVLLEGAWAAVSVASLCGQASGPGAPPTHDPGRA